VDVLGPQLGVFRASASVCWRLSGAIALLLVPLVISRVVKLDPFRWTIAAAAFASLLLVPVVLFALVTPLLWLFRIRVHALGLRGYDAFGRFLSVRWAVMTGTQPMDLLTLRYLRIDTTEAGPRLVVPLFLAEQERFERLVRECAGPQNPLSRFFDERRDEV
jgi:hypothetical protein